MTKISEHPEVRRMLRQCCDGIGVSPTDFDRLVEITRDCPQSQRHELSALLELMRQESLPMSLIIVVVLVLLLFGGLGGGYYGYRGGYYGGGGFGLIGILIVVLLVVALWGGRGYWP